MTKFFACCFVFLFINMIYVTAQTAVYDSVTINAGYANQTFYSLQNGTVSSVSNTNWDLGFQISGFESSIIINSKNNVKLYKAAIDTFTWATEDTTGMLTAANQLYNADSTWLQGAFNRNTTINSGGFNLGWGDYDMTTHIVKANSVYFIVLNGGAVKKIMIQRLESGVYYFKYANLDNTGMMNGMLTKTNFPNKNFGYYNLTTNTTIDREPTKITWDLVFHQYQQEVPFYYKVTGVQHNEGCQAVKAYPVNVNTVAASAYTLQNNISAIGAAWKAFNFGTNTYDIADSTVYFVSDKAGAIWKLIFTGFGGSATGKYYFSKQLVTDNGNGVNETSVNNNFSTIYPNPANHAASLIVNTTVAEKASLTICNLAGQMINNNEVYFNKGLNNIALPISNLSAGLYVVSIHSTSTNFTKKLMVK
jgi:Secretion system C-terminal sorting domain